MAELEDHLREQIAALTDAGLAADEAFLVAVKRMGGIDALSREFAREHSDRLWKQLVAYPSGAEEAKKGAARLDAVVAFCLAALAAALIKLPTLFRFRLDADIGFYARNLSLFVLPPADRLLRVEATPRRPHRRLAGGGFRRRGHFCQCLFVHTEGQHRGAHGIAPADRALAAGGDRLCRRPLEPGRGPMDFVRFSGELFIYYSLIALGGVVLIGFTAMIFRTVGIDAQPFFRAWLLPCGAVGAVVIGSWLVEAKQSVIENMAPVLARLFTPLFAAVLVVFLGTLLWTGRGVDIERNLLIGFDLLLVMVLGLFLYSISARNPDSPPGVFDVMQVLLVVGALLADAIALWAIAARITEFGFSPNRIAALGENVILLVNLAGSAVLYFLFLRRRAAFARTRTVAD